MASNGTPLKAELEVMLKDAQGDLTKAVAEISYPDGDKIKALRFAKLAQGTYEIVRSSAIEYASQPGSLDEVIHEANRQIPHTHLVQAMALHNIGHSIYRRRRNALDDTTRTAFSNAVGGYQTAYSAFKEGAGSYRTAEEQYSRRLLLEQLYPGWASTCFVLGLDAAKGGIRLINFPEPGRLVTPTEILKGLDYIDIAIRYFGTSLGMAEAAKKDIINIAPFENRARSRLVQLNSMAHRAARSISDTERAAKYG